MKFVFSDDPNDNSIKNPYKLAETLETQANNDPKRKIRRKRIFIVVAAIIVGLIIWDFADPPLWWQSEAQQNQKVILDYAKEHYPNAKIVEEVYQSTGLNFTSNPHDYIVFEQNGVTFSIWANDGVFSGENFLSSKSVQYVEHKIIDPFLIPRNINANCSIYFAGEIPPVTSISEYKEGISIHIAPEYVSGKDEPKELGWLYDFYLYIHEHLNNTSISFTYSINRNTCYSAEVNASGKIKSEDEFYAAFKMTEQQYFR